MAIDNNDLVYLLDPVFQIESLAGKPVIGGHIEVYYAGTDLKYITYQNFDHTENPFKIPLNSDGRAVILVEPQYTYDIYVRDSFNNLICSRLNVKPQIGGGNISIKGRTYHGVEPVVVNNQYNLISARNIPLGVQEPLHFVEDSESACVIGVSGLQPSGDYVLRPELSSYATEDWVNSQSYMHEYMASAFYPMESNPSGYLTEHQSLSGYMETGKLETTDGKITGYDGTAFAGGGSVDPSEFIPWSASGNFATSGDLNDKLDTTAFSTVSGDFITAIPDTYASKDFVLSSVSSKLDSTAFSTVSGDFITALPEGLLNESGFEYDGDKISAYNGSAFVGQGGGGITGEYELSAGNGISIDNFPIEQKTVISVTGDYITKNSADTLYYGIDNPSGFITGVDLSDYQTTAGMTAYQPVGDYLTTGDSANFYTTANESGFITGVDLTPYQTVEGMTAYQEAGDYYSASNPSGFITGVDLSDYATTAEVADKQDITGMTAYQPVGDYYSASNPSGFITGVDLTPYQLTADMTAYQPTGDYLTTADSANFYTTANESGFISEVPDTYLQNTDLTIADNKVTEISGIPLSAGTELEFEYDAADNISAINSSAISTTPAQALYAQNPLYFSATGTSSYMGINSADLARILGVDETVLFSGSTQSPSLTDSIWNYKKILLLIGDDTIATKVSNNQMYYTDDIATNGSGFSMFQTCKRIDGGYVSMAAYLTVTNDGSGFAVQSVGGWASWDNSTCSYNGAGTWAPRVYKVIGIGRKEV